MILPNEKKYQHIAVFLMEHGSTVYLHIFIRERLRNTACAKTGNCGVTTIQIEDGVCHVLKESEIFYNKDGE